MKISAFGFAVALLAVGIGAAGGGYWLAQRQAKHELLPSSAPTDERKVLYWYDPMQPEQRCVTPMASAISSFCLALSTPSVMAALASAPNPAMASGCALRKPPMAWLMFWINAG